MQLCLWTLTCESDIKMDLKNRLCADIWANPSSSMNESPKKVPPDHPSFTNFNLHKWEDPSILDYNTRIEQENWDQRMGGQDRPVNETRDSTRTRDWDQRIGSQVRPVSETLDSNRTQDWDPRMGSQDRPMNETRDSSRTQDWDPRMMLTNLSFLEDKIHHLQDLVHTIVGRRAQVVGPTSDELRVQQQQLITADLTSIIVQLISTAGSLLPSVKHSLSSLNPSASQLGHLGQLGGVILPSESAPNGSGQLPPPLLPQNNYINKVKDQSNGMIHLTGNRGPEQIYTVDEHESKDEEDAEEGENLPPGSYEILQLEKEEILAPHTHFCMICGKGFKRDANLRMHMRGHGDEYKTPAALAKPHKESGPEPVLIKRYSCPYVGCKRNRDHKKFQPLKTILCVKNHYKRTHCDKSYTCSRCNTKKFSVLADLKTHEKHCGRDKWLCSCGTTFSRKDKLFGHIALFQGHTPAIPMDENKGLVDCGESNEDKGLVDCGESSEAPKKVARLSFDFGSSGNGIQSGVDDDTSGIFSPLNFDTCNLGGFGEFPRLPFEDAESSMAFLISGSCNYSRKNGGELGSNGQEQMNE